MNRFLITLFQTWSIVLRTYTKHFYGVYSVQNFYSTFIEMFIIECSKYTFDKTGKHT